MVKEKKRNIKKLMMGPHMIYAVISLEEDFAPPAFKTFEDSENFIRTPSTMMLPVHAIIDDESHLQFCIQMEVDLSKEKEEMQQLQKRIGHKSRKKLPMHLSKSWNYNDQNLLKIMIEFLMQKLEVMFLSLQSSEKNAEVFNILKFAQEICRRKTYRQLIRGLKKEILKIFGFEEVAILFHDQKSKSFKAKSM